jgi:hypothetical protein
MLQACGFQSPRHCLVTKYISAIALLQQTMLSKQHVSDIELIEKSTIVMDISYNKSSCNDCCNNLPIIIDTGASISITPHLSNFISSLEPSSFHEIQKISGTSNVVGIGSIVNKSKRPVQTRFIALENKIISIIVLYNIYFVFPL